MKNICIIVPASNEEKTIIEVVSQSQKYGDVIVINDGSSDKTKEYAFKAGAHVISNYRSLGYDLAIIKGINFAISKNYKVIITIDADGQHPLKLIPIFSDYIINNNYEIVIGIRTFFPRFSEKLFNFYARNIHGLTDVLCGMKAYSKDIFINTDTKISENSIGTYYTLQASRNNKNIKQIKIPIKNRIDGKTRIGANYRAEIFIFKALFKCLINDLKYKIMMKSKI